MPSNNILSGDYKKVAIKLLLPILFSSFILSVNSIIDAAWIGRLGAAAVAGIAIALPIVSILQVVGGSYGLGARILIAQYHGKGNKKFRSH